MDWDLCGVCVLSVMFKKGYRMMDVDVAEGGGRGERGKGREAGREAGGSRRNGGREEEERERKEGMDKRGKGGREERRKEKNKKARRGASVTSGLPNSKSKKKGESRCRFLSAQMHLSRKKEMLAERFYW